jgi:hypothetical protein
MKSSQHISNSLLTNQQPSNDEETSTYSFRHITKKLQHAKSYGELYQPQTPLPLPSMAKINNDENEIKHRQKYPSDSPQLLTSRAGSMNTTVPIITRPTINSSDELFNSSSSSSNKIPFWERFKKIITPTKRNKERFNSQISIQSNEIPTNETSKKVIDFQITFN